MGEFFPYVVFAAFGVVVGFVFSAEHKWIHPTEEEPTGIADLRYSNHYDLIWWRTRMNWQRALMLVPVLALAMPCFYYILDFFVFTSNVETF